MDPSLFNLTPLAWAAVVFCAMNIGFSKSGVPGSAALVPPLMATVFPAGESTAILLPLLVVGDLFTVAWYRRHAEWRHVLRPLPWAVAGITLTFILFRSWQPSDVMIRRLIGGIVLFVLLLGIALERSGRDVQVPKSRFFAAFVGMFGGFATMAANAAGSIWAVYLLALRLPKKNFLGTNGWIFLILNVAKLPFSHGLYTFSVPSLLFDLKMAPLVLLGAAAGVWTARRVPQRLFVWIVRGLAMVAALNLLLR